jgi:serine/threonine protein kinase
MHRDIKPANLLFDDVVPLPTSEGSITFPLLKICDFGIIKKQETVQASTIFRGTRFLLLLLI